MDFGKMAGGLVQNFGSAVAGTVDGAKRAKKMVLSIADQKRLAEEKEKVSQLVIDTKGKVENAVRKEVEAKKEIARLIKEKREKALIEEAEEAKRIAEEQRVQAEKEAEEALKQQAILAFGFISTAMDPLAASLACCKLQILMAGADGNIDEVEKSEINEFLSSLGDSDSEKSLAERIHEVLRNPPSVEDVFEEIKSASYVHEVLQGYLDLLLNVMLSDKVVHQSELDLVDRFVAEFELETPALELPYRCANLPRDFDDNSAIVALCLNPKSDRCEIWVNNTYQTVDKPLPLLSAKNFSARFDAEALGELDELGACNAAERVHFIFCGEDSNFKHAQKVIGAGGERYSIRRCPCSA